MALTLCSINFSILSITSPAAAAALQLKHKVCFQLSDLLCLENVYFHICINILPFDTWMNYVNIIGCVYCLLIKLFHNIIQ